MFERFKIPVPALCLLVILGGNVLLEQKPPFFLRCPVHHDLQRVDRNAECIVHHGNIAFGLQVPIGPLLNTLQKIASEPITFKNILALLAIAAFVVYLIIKSTNGDGKLPSCPSRPPPPPRKQPENPVEAEAMELAQTIHSLPMAILPYALRMELLAEVQGIEERFISAQADMVEQLQCLRRRMLEHIPQTTPPLETIWQEITALSQTPVPQEKMDYLMQEFEKIRTSSSEDVQKNVERLLTQIRFEAAIYDTVREYDNFTMSEKVS